MSNAVKTWTPKKHIKSTDDLGLCRVRYFVPVYQFPPLPTGKAAYNPISKASDWEYGRK